MTAEAIDGGSSCRYGTADGRIGQIMIDSPDAESGKVTCDHGGRRRHARASLPDVATVTDDMIGIATVWLMAEKVMPMTGQPTAITLRTPAMTPAGRCQHHRGR